jgi:signal transduction histidine kinase
VGQIRAALARDPQHGVEAIEELQAGLRRVVEELRELARGIHPSILSDRGLLEAVEALAARSVVPVDVRADASLREARFTEAVEGAGYFTVAESLANVGKHSGATSAQVELARTNGTLTIQVRDDGVGFDPATATGEGLGNLAARIAALGGELEITSHPGGGTTVTVSLSTGDRDAVGG